MSSNINKKMELPSVSVKKQQIWKEAEDLYTEGYNELSRIISGVGVIVKNHKTLPAEVDINKVFQLTTNVQKDAEQLRGEINVIYDQLQEAKKDNTDLSDANMYGIVHSASMEEWMGKLSDTILPQFHDLTDYVTQTTGENK